MQPNYKLKDDHVITAAHGRAIYTQLDNAKLNKTGGVITGDIFSATDVNPLNALATKQYVLDNASSGGGGGSGSHPDKIESQDAQKTTSVLCTTDGVTISDDATAIAIISKNIDRTQIRGELSGIAINTNDLLIRSQNGAVDLLNITSLAAQSTVPIRYSDPLFVPSINTELIHKKYMDDSIASEVTARNAAIATAKTQITQLVDSDQADGAKYKLQIANNQLEYFRGADADDLYLKQFGSASSDGVVFQTNKSRYFLESDNAIDAENYVMLRNQVSSDPANMYNKAGIMSLRYGYVGEVTPNAYCMIVAQASESGSGSTRMILYPKTVNNNAELVNQAMFNARLGYETGTILTSQDADSILNRSENDTRYYLTTTTLNNILAPQSSVSMNNQKITAVANATVNSDAVNLDQLTKARQGFSVVRKTTNTQTVNTKVTGFTLQQESNAQKCYWDNANQTFLVSIPNGDASVDVEFRVRITYNITATGNNATFVLRDFTNSSNYADTFLYASKQNQNGYFSENLTIIKNFTTNRFVGLYITAQNGSPPFANLDIVMQAVTITTSTQVNLTVLSNSTATKSVSVDFDGLKADQVGHVWNLNGGVLKGLPLDLYTEPYSGDHAASLDYCNQLVAASGQTQAQLYLTNADGYVFGPSGITNAHAFRKVSTNEDRFIIQNDVPANSTTFTVGQSLNLQYWGAKTLTDTSILTRADILDLIKERRPWCVRFSLGDPSSGTPSVISSTNNFVSSISKVGPSSAAEQGYQINFVIPNCPLFITSNNYLATTQIIASDLAGQSVTLVNDCSPLVTYNQGGSSLGIYWEQTASVTQIVHVGVVFNPITY